MNSAILSLGSNVADRERILLEALDSLGCRVDKATEPYSDDHGYMNIVAAVSTGLDAAALRSHFKEVESKFGRCPGSKTPGDVELDIDIVIFNGEIIRSSDFDQPYFQKGYSKLDM